MLIQRPEYLRFLKEWREQQVIKVVTGAGAESLHCLTCSGRI